MPRTLQVENSQRRLISPLEFQGARRGWADLPASKVAKVVGRAAVRMGFEKVHAESTQIDGDYIGRKAERSSNFQHLPDTMLMVRWEHDYGSTGGRTRFEWIAYSQGPRINDPANTTMFGRELKDELTREIRRRRPQNPPHDPEVGPGERPPTRYTGQMSDFSALAHARELGAFASNATALPIGRAAYGRPPRTRHGAALCLPRPPMSRDVRTPTEELGILVCAPQGSGKTHLLLQWAVAAIRNGRSVFIVDVIGTMRGLLDRTLAREKLRPEVFEFTTAPRARSDRMNLLAEFSPADVDCVFDLQQLAEALMPQKEGVKGNELFQHQYVVRFLHGALMLLKLMEWHGKFGTRRVDFTDLFGLIEDEDDLVDRIVALAAAERQNAGRRSQPRYSVSNCIQRLKLAIAKTSAFKGQRPPDRTYDEYVVPVMMALEPFETGSVIAERVRSFGSGREISLSRFGRKGPSAVIILTAREDDSSIASALLTTAVGRLLQVLKHRRHIDANKRNEVLLLLDETARVAGFDVADFVSRARHMHVGYALVYQHLDQICPRSKISGVMRNIGTQIYLREIVGNDLAQLNKHLRGLEATRELASANSAAGNGSERSYTQSVKEVPFIPIVAPRWLPAGRRPALVYSRALQTIFLVDLEDDSERGRH